VLRWFCAAVVVLCSALLSMNEVLRSRERLEGLRALTDALCMLREALTNLRSPLPDLLRLLADRCRGPAARVFLETERNLVKREQPVSVAWEKAVMALDPLLLRPEERQALLALGHILGRSGSAEQAAAIRNAEERLRLFTELEDKECMKRSRVRAAVGTGAGIMLAILLL